LEEREFIKKHGKNIDVKSLKNLLKNFYFVGITENYDEDSLFLYYKLGIKKFYENQNVSKKYYTKNNFFKIKNRIRISGETKELSNNLYTLCIAKNKKFKKNNLFFYPIIIYMRIKKRFYYLINKNQNE
jgi:hypothetical protein